MGCCRQDEGSSPEGYTLQEACTLTRSSLTKQRVLAVRILAAVMAAARPQARHHDAAGVLLPQHVTLPSYALRNANQDVVSHAACCNCTVHGWKRPDAAPYAFCRSTTNTLVHEPQSSVTKGCMW